MHDYWVLGMLLSRIIVSISRIIVSIARIIVC